MLEKDKELSFNPAHHQFPRDSLLESGSEVVMFRAEETTTLNDELRITASPT
jgi:hypothetical protein